MIQEQVQLVIAHYGINRKITQEECLAALPKAGIKNIFIDFGVGHAQLDDLFDLPFENIALAQRRQFADVLKPLLDQYPDATIAYFGFAPMPVALHLGYLVGNTHPYTIYQLHHQSNTWYAEGNPPRDGYVFQLKPTVLPKEKQRGKGDVVIRIGTSFSIDPQSTAAVIQDPANEFDIELTAPDIDSLSRQDHIHAVVNAFQEVLNTYSNLLTDREQIHLFVSSSAGLPFALGTRINTNIYPYIQTYQYSKSRAPKHRAAILISRSVSDRIVLTDKDRKAADVIRKKWETQLQSNIKPFIVSITGNKPENWLRSVCETMEEYSAVSLHLRSPWDCIPDISRTSLVNDRIDLGARNIEEGFEYTEKTNSWMLDDGFLAGLNIRLAKGSNGDILQAGRLFFFHEALHYSKHGHRLTKEIATGIGQFPKVIEEADYQADVWALLTEYRYCRMFEPGKLKGGIKRFFCDAIDTAVETMWSFIDTGRELTSIQIRSMSRFLNWYWQWLLIENLDGEGRIEEVVRILFQKPVIDFAGAPMELIAHRTFFKLNGRQHNNLQLAGFISNRVSRFAPTATEEIVSGFRLLDGERIKAGLKSFQVSLY